MAEWTEARDRPKSLASWAWDAGSGEFDNCFTIEIIAFISGVVVIVIMIPINTYIASVIQSATGKCSIV